MVEKLVDEYGRFSFSFFQTSFANFTCKGNWIDRDPSRQPSASQSIVLTSEQFQNLSIESWEKYTGASQPSCLSFHENIGLNILKDYMFVSSNDHHHQV